jgi:hypothetical protein
LSNSTAQTAGDGYLLGSERTGNFEWWYFDCVDARNGCMLKVVVHLGTDPLRRRFFPTLAVSVRTPRSGRDIERKYSLQDFQADKDRCDVRPGRECHIHKDAHDREIYHIDVDIPGFRASLNFTRTVPAWVPPALRVTLRKGKRQSDFFGTFRNQGRSSTGISGSLSPIIRWKAPLDTMIIITGRWNPDGDSLLMKQLKDGIGEDARPVRIRLYLWILTCMA